MKSKRLAFAAVLIVAAYSGVPATRAAEETRTVGRVRVSVVEKGDSAREARVAEALDLRFAPQPGHRFPDRRVISVRPRPGDPKRFDATIYDYTVERAFDLVLDGEGNEVGREALAGQPARSLGELADASAIVKESGGFAEEIGAGDLEIYEAMPPVTVDGKGRRLVNVGVIAHPEAGKTVSRNEIVSVHIPTGEIVRHPSGAPETALAGPLACGPATSGCSYAVGPCATYQIVWPADEPVWRMKVRHPKCTQSVQNDGTGLEITDVYFEDRLILKRGEMPVLNVLYDGNTCGPYRDWLYSEDCFQAVGTDVPGAGSGVRVASAPPSTLCETSSDAGNFKGVAIYDQGNALWLMTETNAGWYRYVMEWRFHLDGTIEPIFGFGATSNNCTCNAHDHHGYWRFEWAVDAVSDGTVDDPATGIVTLERRQASTPDAYDPIPSEGTFLRPTTGWQSDWWRIRNPLTGNGYVIQPGSADGHAVGDAYAKWDLAALALNPGEINDPNTNTSVNVAPWVGGEPLGAGKRLVTWYHATYRHDEPGAAAEACEIAGPRFVPLTPCAGVANLDRTVYACDGPVGVTLVDADLAGQGTASVSLVSETETAPETLVLAETPPGSGKFTGSAATASGAPVPGNGAVSVAHGDTLRVRYLDASACGAPDLVVERTSAIDCLPPSIANLRSTVAGSAATIRWDTVEPSTSVVHFGPVLPAAATASSPGRLAAHEVELGGLAECTTYYFWVESADEAGNAAASNGGGGYHAFTTGRDEAHAFSSADTPLPIPDNDPGGVVSKIDVTDPRTVTDVNVSTSITHSYDADLTLVLETPAGGTIPLATRRGGSGNDFAGTIFDDEAAAPISSGTAPFAGSYRPESPLSSADGLAAAGVWQLAVVDHAGQDVGTIDSWEVALAFPQVACPVVGPPPPVPDGTSGTAMTAARVGDLGSTVALAWNASTCPAKNYHLLYGSLGSLASYSLDGGVCGLGPLGSYAWEGSPAGDLWFVVVADDANSAEGSWGRDGTGAERNGATPSGRCGFTLRTNAAACP